MSIQITALLPEHWEAVLRIYAEGLATRNATFETIVPSWETWDASKRLDCRLVAIDNDSVVGWAAISSTSKRDVYRGVVEHSIYIAGDSRGKGVGKKLLMTLIDATEAAGIWTIQTSIFPENIASVALHKKCGFREIGYRERVAKLDDAWRNTLL
ncbi:MAG: GNAT family N-acetyltransferase, partial [Aggregatilineales bacterium]